MGRGASGLSTQSVLSSQAQLLGTLGLIQVRHSICVGIVRPPRLGVGISD